MKKKRTLYKPKEYLTETTDDNSCVCGHTLLQHEWIQYDKFGCWECTKCGCENFKEGT